MPPVVKRGEVSSDQITDTTCAYCGVGCGIKVFRDEAKPSQGTERCWNLAADTAHPANLGRLCSKGSALTETLGMQGRLLSPKIHGQNVNWNRALDHVAKRFSETLKTHGPNAVALYVSGQLLTEDYYVANKLTKGFMGSGNIDTNSRLCMSSAVAAHTRAFGEDLVPGCYQDLEIADLVVLVGSNTAWAHPVVYQRIAAAKEQRPQMRVVVVDPRRTATCEIADLHLAIEPGSDAVLFNGVLAALADTGQLDDGFIAAHTQGFDQTLDSARRTAPSAAAVAALCKSSTQDVERFLDWFCHTERVVTLFSQGINQSSSGVDKGNAIINCHLASGRIGKPGAAPFSITGQPNAMGGREVGGLASMLAAHMPFGSPDDLDRVARFWKAPRIAAGPGLKAVDLFRAVHAGQVRALWIAGTNPAVSMPESDFVQEALRRCEFLVVSECVEVTDTSRYAEVLLPAAGWGEKDGTVTNSERRISRQRAFLPLPGEARPDWWMFAQVGARLGHPEAFDYPSAAAVFREHAALSGFENNASRAFDISGLHSISDQAYDQLQPVQWPVNTAHPQGCERLFSDGRFYTADQRARFIPVQPEAPRARLDQSHPVLLNTGRLRDQWHTMTRTGKVPRLTQHREEPELSLSPEDADRLGCKAGDLVEVENERGRLVLRLRLDPGMQSGQAFAPIHWNDQYAAHARVGQLIAAVTDPHSGQPEFKQTAVRVSPYQPAWQGFLVTRGPIPAPAVDYWVRLERPQCARFELADRRPVQDFRQWLLEHTSTPLGIDSRDATVLEYSDTGTGRTRLALIADDRLQAVAYLDPAGRLPPRDWIEEQFHADQLPIEQRRALLAGRPSSGLQDTGPVICSCFQVGKHSILDVITRQGATNVEQIGAQLQAGTNCGSCIPELRNLIADANAAADSTAPVEAPAGITVDEVSGAAPQPTQPDARSAVSGRSGD